MGEEHSQEEEQELGIMSSFNVETLEATQSQQQQQLQIQEDPSKKRIRWGLVLICMACAGVGTIGAPLMQRLYYLHGGSRKWLCSCLQTVGFPIVLLPLSLLYSRTYSQETLQTFFIERRLIMASSILGFFSGLCNYMYSAGLAYIPVSTSSLLFSTQLAFTALFAFVIVKQKFSFHSVNCVVLMTLGASVLALNTSGDRPPGVSREQYLEGFFLTLGGAVLFGVILPTIELCYRKAGQVVTWAVVLQFQIIGGFSATAVCLVGMAINEDFEATTREAKAYELGEEKYYLVLVCSAILWQLLSVASLGIIYCTSSLFTGIVGAFLLPFTQVAAVLAFGEKFTAEKGLSLALCLWGFTSYLIGEYKKSKKMTPKTEAVADHSITV